MQSCIFLLDKNFILHLTAHPLMAEVKKSLRQRIKRSNVPLKKIARESGASYDRLYNWFHGRTLIFDADDAAKVDVFLREGAK